MRTCGFGSFIAGLIVGGAIALLMAPQSGEETREMIKDMFDRNGGNCGMGGCGCDSDDEE